MRPWKVLLSLKKNDPKCLCVYKIIARQRKNKSFLKEAPLKEFESVKG